MLRDSIPLPLRRVNKKILKEVHSNGFAIGLVVALGCALVDDTWNGTDSGNIVKSSGNCRVGDGGFFLSNLLVG